MYKAELLEQRFGLPFRPNALNAINSAEDIAHDLNRENIVQMNLLIGALRNPNLRFISAMRIADIFWNAAELEVANRPNLRPGSAGFLPLSERAEKTLRLGVKEAHCLGDQEIGNEHIILGMLREGEGLGWSVLRSAGLDLVQVRANVIRSREPVLQLKAS